jgi:ABC-2 type transport system permease protein
MKRLLSIELQKIWQNRASKILTITYFLTLGLVSLIASIEFDLGPFKFEAAKSGIFNFPIVWHFGTYFAAILKLFLAVVIVSMIANEYSYGTLKQNLIDGMSKKEFLLSKFYTISLFALISTLFIFIITLILGLKFSSYDEVSIIFSDLEYFAAYFVKLLGFFSFCIFLGILIKRSAFALGFLFIWYIFENISIGILKYEVFNYKRGEITIFDTIKQHFPLESMSNLIVEPISRLNFVKSISNSVGADLSHDYGVHFYQIAIVLCWIFIFLFLSFRILKKRDL